MFRITAGSCRTCTLAEVLIMAAMNADAIDQLSRMVRSPRDSRRSPLLTVRASLAEGLASPSFSNRRDQHGMYL